MPIATSIKSIDIRAKTYINPSALESRLKGYIDKVAEFKGGKLKDYVIRSHEIKGLGLEVAIPKGATTPEQLKVFEKMIEYGEKAGVKVKIIEVP